MPLNRDATENNVSGKSVAEFTTHRQHARDPATSQRRMLARPNTPLESGSEAMSRSRSREGVSYARQSTNVGGPGQNNGQPDHIDDMTKFKLPIVDTVQIHKERMLKKPSLEQQDSLQKKSDYALSRKISKSSNHTAKKVGKVSAFDDTESISQSMLDDSFGDNITTIFRPPAAQPLQSYTQKVQQEPTQPESPPDATQDALLKEIMSSNWQEQVQDEKKLQQQRQSAIKLHNVKRSLQAGEPQHRMSIVTDAGSSPDAPETPSRIQSVPPGMSSLHAPVARRAVDFVSSPEVFGDSTGSPAFNSARMASEESPRPTKQRPSSAESAGIAFHHKQHWTTPGVQPTFQHGVLSKSHPRFQKFEEHKQRLLPTNVDNLPTEHEALHSQSDEVSKEQQSANIPGHPDANKTFNRKRSFDRSQSLDYDPDTLFQKTLFDLQNEPFTTDPRQPPQPPATNSHAGEMTHEQVLQNLHRLTPERQREIFQAQNDEEWEATGKWFVDMFQQDLKLLTEVRLNRRKVALQFEDKIRRRQRLVEHQMAEVNKELGALQDGGAGLLKDRKPVGSSRAGTPVRAVRP